MPRLFGRVIEKWSNVPVANALVSIDGRSVLSRRDGSFIIDTTSQSVNFNVSHNLYEGISTMLALSLGDNDIDIVLTPIMRAL